MKLQASNFKLHAIALSFASFWLLEFLWSLDVGAWCFLIVSYLLDQFLEVIVQNGGSDLHIGVGRGRRRCDATAMSRQFVKKRLRRRKPPGC